MNHDEDDNPFYPCVDLGEFRYTVAKYVKLLIRARWKRDPDFLAVAELRQWELTNIADDAETETSLVAQAADALGDINTRFVRRCGSGGVKETNADITAERLIDEALDLCDAAECISGPTHNRALTQAAEDLSTGRQSKWTSLINWAMLSSIRADLDLLPHPRARSKRTKRYIFRRRGEDWEIQYGTGELNRYRDLRGLTHIWHMIQQSGKRLSPTDLQVAAANFNASSPSHSMVTVGDSANANERIDDSEFETENGDKLVDDEAIKQYRNRLAKIKKEKQEADEQSDRDALEDEENIILKELSETLPILVPGGV